MALESSQNGDLYMKKYVAILFALAVACLLVVPAISADCKVTSACNGTCPHGTTGHFGTGICDGSNCRGTGACDGTGPHGTTSHFGAGICDGSNCRGTGACDGTPDRIRDRTGKVA
jgi:hypothetical protein